jgi:hypothetical protein
MTSNVTTAHAKSTVTRRLLAIIMLAILCAWPAGTAWAKDSMTVSVTNATGSPVIVDNGQASGTIQLFYTVNANAFTVGEFATFDLNWVTASGAGKATDYTKGVTFSLIQSQQGGYVDFVPNPSSFALTFTGQSDKSKVTVYVARDQAGNLPPDVDGTELVGNLKLDAGSDVGTVTNIQVHILLVHPTNCLKVYNFVTDLDFNELLTTSLNVPVNGRNAGKVVSSQPGQVSDNVLIANTCATDRSFDLGIGLDSSFSVSANGNPVKAYAAAGEFDSSDFNALLVTDPTYKGQSLCLQNVTVAAGTSFLATVHTGIKSQWPQGSLPADGTFDFAASLYQNVNSGCTAPLDPLATPNPATFTLPFTIK